MAVKVANLRLLQKERPDILRLTTYNAEVNGHMIGVNEAMGFVPVARLGDFQKKLQRLAALPWAWPSVGSRHVRRAPQVNALIPVSARPISSFWICEVPS